MDEEILVWSPSCGCNQTVTGARTVEGLEPPKSCQVSPRVSLHKSWFELPHNMAALGATKDSSASISVPRAAAASTLMT